MSLSVVKRRDDLLQDPYPGFALEKFLEKVWCRQFVPTPKQWPGGCNCETLFHTWKRRVVSLRTHTMCFSAHFPFQFKWGSRYTFTFLSSVINSREVPKSQNDCELRTHWWIISIACFEFYLLKPVMSICSLFRLFHSVSCNLLAHK